MCQYIHYNYDRYNGELPTAIHIPDELKYPNWQRSLDCCNRTPIATYVSEWPLANIQIP